MESVEHVLGQALIEESSLAVLLIDTEQRIQFLNGATERIFGYDQADLTGQPLDLLIPAHYRQIHQELRTEVDGGRPRGEWTEIRGLRCSGESFPAEASITHVTWNGTTYMVALVHDCSGAKALEAERRRLAEILEATPDFVGMADAEGHVLYRNRSAQNLMGPVGANQKQTPHIAQTHPPDEARRILSQALPSARKDGHWEGETNIQLPGGSTIPVSQIIQAHYDGSGEVTYYSTIARDLRPYREVEHRLHTLSAALDQAADLVWITDTDGRVEYVNPAFEATTGYTAEEARGNKIGAMLKSGFHGQAFYERMWSRLLAGQTYRDVFTNITRDGHEIHLDETISPVRDADGTTTHFIATGRDITERLALEGRLRYLAYYDHLTGLANRSHFEEQLSHSLARAEQSQQPLALLMLDLDRFTDINDSLGHAAGDELLVQVSQRLSGILRTSDLVARWGGDEFVIMLDPISGTEGVQRFAETLRQTLESDFTIHGATFHAHISIGISLFPETAQYLATLLQQADIAMFEAKGAAGSDYRFFSPRDSESADNRFHGERHLQQALADETCEPFFQPFIDLQSGTVIGAEALARCRFSGTEEWVPPVQFIPLAERTGLIHQLGAQILLKACRQFKQWRADGYALQRLAVNLSPVQLTSTTLGRFVTEVLEEMGGDPRWLELEVTEEAALGDETTVLAVLEEFSRQGIALALDDFGKGYSSPANLQKLPVSRMKIDRAFIQDVNRDSGNQAIVKGLLGFAEGFGCQITAEGIESSEEADYLRSLGVDEAQGFLFGRPMRAQEFEQAFLLNRSD